MLEKYRCMLSLWFDGTQNIEVLTIKERYQSSTATASTGISNGSYSSTAATSGSAALVAESEAIATTTTAAEQATDS